MNFGEDSLSRARASGALDEQRLVASKMKRESEKMQRVLKDQAKVDMTVAEKAEESARAKRAKLVRALDEVDVPDELRFSIEEWLKEKALGPEREQQQRKKKRSRKRRGAGELMATVSSIVTERALAWWDSPYTVILAT